MRQENGRNGGESFDASLPPSVTPLVTAAEAAARLAQIRRERREGAIATLKHRLRHHVLPYLKRQIDAGLPGLGERDRTELTDSAWDILAALTDLEIR